MVKMARFILCVSYHIKKLLVCGFRNKSCSVVLRTQPDQTDAKVSVREATGRPQSAGFRGERCATQSVTAPASRLPPHLRPTGPGSPGTRRNPAMTGARGAASGIRPEPQATQLLSAQRPPAPLPKSVTKVKSRTTFP